MSNLRKRAEKLLEITKKLRDGKKLSASEEMLIAGDDEPPEYFESKAQIASYYDVSQKAVRNWLNSANPPFEPDENGFAFAKVNAIRRAYIANSGHRCEGDYKAEKFLKSQNKKNILDQSGENKQKAEDIDELSPEVEEFDDSSTLGVEVTDEYDFSDIESLKGKKLALECEKLQAHIQVLRQKWTSVEHALAQFRAMIYATKEKLRRLPSELAYEVSGVSPAEAEQKIRDGVDRICEELAAEDYSKLVKSFEEVVEHKKRIDPRAPSGRKGHINPLAN